MRTIVMLALLTATSVHAQAYKCVVNGSTHYQDSPCSNAPSKAVDTRPAAEGVTGLKRDAQLVAAKEAQQAAVEKKSAEDKAARRAERRENARRTTTCTSNYAGGLTCR